MNDTGRDRKPLTEEAKDRMRSKLKAFEKAMAEIENKPKDGRHLWQRGPVRSRWDRRKS